MKSVSNLLLKEYEKFWFDLLSWGFLIVVDIKWGNLLVL